MNRFIELNYGELLQINGGDCPKCRKAGREFARIVKENAIWEAIVSAWDEAASWFD